MLTITTLDVAASHISFGGGLTMGKYDAGKTLIGVLASHDSIERNNSLARLLERLREDNAELLDKFHFLFTGGTYRRIIAGSAEDRPEGVEPVNRKTREFLIPRSTCLPSRKEGGVTLLAYFVVQRRCSILWPFLTPATSHWLTPENLALMRLSDQWHVKRLMNSGSVSEWFREEADMDSLRSRQRCPLTLDLAGTRGRISPARKKGGGYEIRRPARPTSLRPLPRKTLALIAHDQMKSRMVEFATDYERELARFKRILCTGTTGSAVAAAARTLDEREKIYRYNSGPKGGDIEIATEILFGRCHVVVFFIDPLNPHPHIEDIRVVFGACMIEDEVRMLTNEMQARDWMDRVVKGIGGAGRSG